MDYQYIPPVPRVHRVSIDCGLQTYSDLWFWEDEFAGIAALSEKVTSWLEEHAKGSTTQCDHGEWNHLAPVFYIDFPSKKAALAFMVEFSREEAAALEIRTIRYPTDLYSELVFEENGQRWPDRELTLHAVRLDPEVKARTDCDQDGEFVEWVFSSQTLAQRMDRIVRTTWMKRVRENADLINRVTDKTTE